MRNNSARDDDCDGPMNRHRTSPHSQKDSGPDSVTKMSATVMIAASDTTMTGLDPIQWSTRPPTTAPNAATTLAATPNTNTSAWVRPYALTPITAPKANIAVSPSR